MPEAEEYGLDFFKMTVQCWSINCGDNIIRYNLANFTFWTNKEDTNQPGKNGTYIFYVELDQIDKENWKDESSIETYVFELGPSTKKSVKGLNITAPFDEWIKANKGTLGWYSPPPKVTAKAISTNSTAD